MPPPIPKPISPVSAPVKRAPRVRLADATSGVISAPVRVLVYGVDKIGKSTFGACAPKAIFFGAEDGSKQLDVHRFPQPANENGDQIPTEWTDMLDAVEQLTHEPHSYQSLVIDTVDWLEPLLHAWICQRDGKGSIEDYGFGKGYVAALDQWRVLLSRLDAMVHKRKMNVILLGHALIKNFKNPEGEDYDRFELAIHAKASGLIRQWVDAALFANHEIYSVASKNGDRHRGVATGNRVIHTERSAAWDAGNRYSLPAQLPLSWDAFWDAVRASVPRSLSEVTAELATLVARVPEAARAKVQEQIDGKAGNVPALERYAAALREKLGAEQAA